MEARFPPLRTEVIKYNKRLRFNFGALAACYYYALGREKKGHDNQVKEQIAHWISYCNLGFVLRKITFRKIFFEK